MRWLVRSCLFFMSFIWSSMAWASPWVAVVSPAHHYAIVHRIEAALYTAYPDRQALIWIDPSKLQNHRILHECDASQDLRLIVTVGPTATRAMLREKPELPILAILLYKDVFEEILEEFSITKDSTQISAVYLNQPFQRILNFAQLIMPISKERPLQVSMVLGSASTASVQRFTQQAAKSNVILNLAHINPQVNPIEALNQVIEGTDVLIARPDATVFNVKTARGILLTAYRHHIPMIGYSETYVKMGALAALSVTPKQVARQSTEMILKALADPNTRLPAPQSAAYFTIFVNHHVAEALHIPTPSEPVLQAQLESMERLEQSRISSKESLNNARMGH